MQRALAWPALIFCLLAGLTVGCIEASSASLPRLPGDANPPQADRTSCDQIDGTAFGSTAERDWYEQNCSQWPGLGVPQSDAVTAPSEPAEIDSFPADEEA